MTIPKRFIPHYTYEDYKQWKGNWELIDGTPFAMFPYEEEKVKYYDLGYPELKKIHVFMLKSGEYGNVLDSDRG